MKLVLKTLDGLEFKRRIKDFGYEGDIADEDPNAALVITEMDDTLTYLPLNRFICEQWMDNTVTVKEDWR
ncbi:hypothetical protein [Siphovirus Jomon_CT89]|nr:hypothetical protein [Siphovirus Jomon_CT89]